MAQLGGGAEAHARFKQYEYRANSSLVLTTDSRPRDTHEPTGEPESLHGRIDPRTFGDRAYRGRPAELDEKLTKSKKKKERDPGQPSEAGNVRQSKKRRLQEESVLTSTEEGVYQPKTKETRAAYEAMLSVIQQQLGGQPLNIVSGAADEILAVLKNDTLKNPDKKKHIEKLLAPIPGQVFDQLVSIGRLITDFQDAADGNNTVNGEDTLDDDVGVAVEFEENDEYDLDMVQEADEEEEDDVMDSDRNNGLQMGDDDESPDVTVPSEGGRKNLMLYFMCDSYMGCDQESGFSVDVKEAYKDIFQRMQIFNRGRDREPCRDLYEGILLKLEVADLIRCKTICKYLHSVISTPHFVKSHLNYNLSKRHTHEIGDTRIIVSKSTSHIFCDDECGCSILAECHLVGSCNGLVCISCSHDTYFLVVNPYTCEVKELGYLDHQYNYYDVYVSGFGYDSCIDDFKIVIGHSFQPDDDLMFEVLELKKNLWRTSAVKVGRHNDYLGGDGILYNGAIHWLLYPERRNKKSTKIVCFDLSKEVFLEITLPKLNEEWTLGTMKDRLCVFCFPNPENYKEIEIWVMRNDNVQVSWERKLLPSGYDPIKLMVNYSPRKILLKGNIHTWLLEEGSGAPVLVRSIDHPQIEGQEHIRLSTYPECDCNYDEHVFVQSLVSPHGTGADGPWFE